MNVVINRHCIWCQNQLSESRRFVDISHIGLIVAFLLVTKKVHRLRQLKCSGAFLMPSCPLSIVRQLFLKNGQITSFLAWSFLMNVLIYCKNMDLVESSVNFCSFFTWRPFYPKLFDKLFFILACSFPRRVLMMDWPKDGFDWIALRVVFPRSERSEKGQI